MALPEEYLTYPHRSHGMDQDLYPWRLSIDRPKIAWPGGAAVAAMIVVPLEFHRLNPQGKPFKHPGAMQTTYPDLRHFTTRDYGSRVGVFRILDALKEKGLKATFPINAVLLERARPLVEAIVADGHEIAAYGLEADAIHWSGLESGVEADWAARTREAFDKAGLKPRVWMSPARQQSFQTLELIAGAGFDICLDWEQDTVPVPMKTANGVVWAAPLSNELDDRTLLTVRLQSEDEWADQILEAVRLHKAEAGRFGGQMVSFTLTPYISGLPFRMKTVRRVLDGLSGDAQVWTAGAGDIVEAARG
jgi:allantoinase